jgi:hypothetical protein
MPIDESLSPDLGPRKVGFVPYGRLKVAKSGLESLGEAFQIGIKKTEDILGAAEREELTRAQGIVVDPTITSEDLDAQVDEMRFSVTKMKLRNRQGELMFEQGRGELEESIRNEADPAAMRAQLRQYREQQLAGTNPLTDPVAAGWMERFGPFADRSIRQAHERRERVLFEQDQAVEGQKFQLILENSPDEYLGELIEGSRGEFETGGDMMAYHAARAQGLENHVLENPDEAELVLERIEEVLDANVTTDPKERARYLGVRRRIYSIQEQALAEKDANYADLKRARQEQNRVAAHDLSEWLRKNPGKTPPEAKRQAYIATLPTGSAIFNADAKIDDAVRDTESPTPLPQPQFEARLSAAAAGNLTEVDVRAMTDVSKGQKGHLLAVIPTNGAGTAPSAPPVLKSKVFKNQESILKKQVGFSEFRDMTPDAAATIDAFQQLALELDDEVLQDPEALGKKLSALRQYLVGDKGTGAEGKLTVAGAREGIERFAAEKSPEHARAQEAISVLDRAIAEARAERDYERVGRLEERLARAREHAETLPGIAPEDRARYFRALVRRKAIDLGLLSETTPGYEDIELFGLVE